MPINVRFEADVAVLSNFGRLLNDPRHFDASRDVRAELELGRRKFVLDLVGLRDIGSAGLGLLMTLTRLIRKYDGDAVLANLGPDLEKFLDEMRMDTYWEIFKTIDEAKAYYDRGAV
ncbi:MAG: STAS domain-containing protein [Planctomycetia bacterium]|nr:STAS domain-containing protein [Planctomycetia bacterium]